MYTDTDVALGLDRGRPYDAAHASLPASVGFEGCNENEKKQIEEGLKWACADEQTNCVTVGSYADACKNLTTIRCKHIGDPECEGSQKGRYRCGSSSQAKNRITICFPLSGPPRQSKCPSLRCLLLHELVHIGYQGADQDDEEQMAENCEDKCCVQGEATKDKKYPPCPTGCE